MPSPNSKRGHSYKHRGRVYPTLLFVTQLHDEILGRSGGLLGIRDEGLLESALVAPVRTVDKQDIYYTFFEKVAALGFLLARNHAFNDANKRTALFTMLQTLEWNHYYVRWTQDTETVVISLLGAGYLDAAGLRHALLLGCKLEPGDASL